MTDKMPCSNTALLNRYEINQDNLEDELIEDDDILEDIQKDIDMHRKWMYEELEKRKIRRLMEVKI